MLNRREFCWLCAIIVTLTSTMVWIRIATVRETYRFVQKERDLSHLNLAIQDARVRWLRATSPRELTRIAHKEQLRAPHSHEVLEYEPEASRDNKEMVKR